MSLVTAHLFYEGCILTISTAQIQHVLQGVTIPPQPQVLVDIHMEQVMPTPDIHRVADLISHDAGLSGSVLKVVNSKYFERSNEIHSITQACRLLGLDRIIHIINGLSIKGEMTDETVVQMTKFWDSATDVALCSALIAKRIGFFSPEIAYNLGLFRDCGIPLLMQKHADYLKTLETGYQNETGRVIDIENTVYRTNHAVVGYYIARSWHCPPLLCETIAEHHNASRIFNDSVFENYEPTKKTLLAVLKMAERVTEVHKTLGNTDVSHEWQQSSEALLNYVGLSSCDFEVLTDQIKEMGICL